MPVALDGYGDPAALCADAASRDTRPLITDSGGTGLSSRNAILSRINLSGWVFLERLIR